MACKQYYKILLFMKRRPGMTLEDFRNYYETRHAPLALQQGSSMARYIRRYIEPQPNPATGEAGELPYDVVTELWFSEEKAFRGTVAYLSTTIMPDEIVEDEKKLFDRSTMRMATVIEYESDLSN